MGTSLSSAASAFDRPNRSAALAACGLVSFIWPSSAPTSKTGEVPPICSWICFQLHPFSRLISRIFSVRPARVMGVSLVSMRVSGSGPVVHQARPGWCSHRCGRPMRSDDRLGHARPNYRHAAAIVVVALHLLGEALAAGDQEIDDVIADAVIERVLVEVGA